MKIAALTLFFAFAVSAPLEEIAKSVTDDISTFEPPPGYVNVGQKQYYIHNATPANWHAAWLECRLRNGYLASFRSRDELHVLSSYLESMKITNQAFWVGGNSLAASKQYVWINDGHSVGIDLFSAGKPDGSNACLQLSDIISQSSANRNVEYLLVNKECNENALYICQLEGAKISVTVV